MNQSTNLLIKRERKEVLGRNYANLWLLTVMIAITFLSIAFSNASMDYLADRMDDPFTNWVNVDYNDSQDADRSLELKDSLSDKNVMERFGIDSYQFDSNANIIFESGEGNVYSGRIVDGMDNNLIRAILTSDNIVSDGYYPAKNIDDELMGLIVTEKLLDDLDVKNANPPFVNIAGRYDTDDPFELGVKSEYLPIPFPIIAVVKKLPSNYYFVASEDFLEEYKKNDGATVMTKPEYFNSLIYFVKGDDIEAFESGVKSLLPESEREYLATRILDDEMKHLMPPYKGHFIRVFPFRKADSQISDYNAVDSLIRNHWSNDDVIRVWDYKFEHPNLQKRGDYISINFNNLGSIKNFQDYMLEQFDINVDMAQVITKENFNAVSTLANILSWAMIVFSCGCIILFIVNMLQSYFQKVKRNLGTFKAFGMANSDLFKVYVGMLFGIVLVAIVASFVFCGLIEILMYVLGILKDGKYSFLTLISGKTFLSALIIIATTVVTVYLVMARQLKNTPGDLIYDR